VTKSSSISSGTSSKQNSPQPPPPEAVPATPSPLPRSSTVPAPQAVEQNTPAIRIERERPFAVAGQTPLPTTPQVPGAFVSAIAPPVPAKPSGNVGPPGFTRRSEAVAPTCVCSPDCRVVAEGSDIPYEHRFPCLKSDFEAINIWSRPRNDAPQPKSKQNRCVYCESVRHTRHSDCPEFLKDYAVNNRAARQQPPPPPSNPLPERMDEDVPGEDGFSGYDSPQGGPSGNASSSGGNLPPCGRNAGGVGDPGDSDSLSHGDSDSSLPDPRKFLGRGKSHWNDARKEKYDRRCHELAEYLQKQYKCKKSAHRPKKPEKLGVDPFKGDSTDTQHFIQDCEIKLDYFRESLRKEWDKVSLVIPLLQGPAKKWYQSIHPYVSEEGARREGIPFHLKNVLCTWQGFRQRLVSSFGGHSDRDRAFREWNDLTMKSGKIDHFADALMSLALELAYRGNFVKDKARVCIPTDLRNAWALKTPLPDEYVEYMNLLRQTGPQLEDVASSNRTVTKEKHHSRPEKSDDRQSSAKRQGKDTKSSGPRQQKPRNYTSGSSRPQETEHTKMHRDIPQTLIDKRKRLNQCSGYEQAGHYWAKCPAGTPVVASSRIKRKRGAGEAGYKATQVPQWRCIEAAPKPAVKQVVAEVRGSPPPDLDILEIDTHMDS